MFIECVIEWVNRADISTFQKIKIMQTMFSDHSGTISEINKSTHIYENVNKTKSWFLVFSTKTDKFLQDTSERQITQIMNK